MERTFCRPTHLYLATPLHGKWCEVTGKLLDMVGYFVVPFSVYLAIFSHNKGWKKWYERMPVELFL
jgi:hypothetical protein